MLTYERYQALRAINIRVPGEPGNEARNDCSSQIVIRFRSELCLWNGKLGFEALLSFVPRVTALAPGSNLASSAPGTRLDRTELSTTYWERWKITLVSCIRVYGGVNLSILLFLSPPEAVSVSPVVQSSSPVH